VEEAESVLETYACGYGSLDYFVRGLRVGCEKGEGEEDAVGHGGMRVKESPIKVKDE